MSKLPNSSDTSRSIPAETSRRQFLKGAGYATLGAVVTVAGLEKLEEMGVVNGWMKRFNQRVDQGVRRVSENVETKVLRESRVSLPEFSQEQQTDIFTILSNGNVEANIRSANDWQTFLAKAPTLHSLQESAGKVLVIDAGEYPSLTAVPADLEEQLSKTFCKITLLKGTPQRQEMSRKHPLTRWGSSLALLAGASTAVFHLFPKGVRRSVLPAEQKDLAVAAEVTQESYEQALHALADETGIRLEIWEGMQYDYPQMMQALPIHTRIFRNLQHNLRGVPVALTPPSERGHDDRIMVFTDTDGMEKRAIQFDTNGRSPRDAERALRGMLSDYISYFSAQQTGHMVHCWPQADYHFQQIEANIGKLTAALMQVEAESPGEVDNIRICLAHHVPAEAAKLDRRNRFKKNCNRWLRFLNLSLSIPTYSFRAGIMNLPEGLGQGVNIDLSHSVEEIAALLRQSVHTQKKTVQPATPALSPENVFQPESVPEAPPVEQVDSGETRPNTDLPQALVCRSFIMEIGQKNNEVCEDLPSPYGSVSIATGAGGPLSKYADRNEDSIVIGTSRTKTVVGVFDGSGGSGGGHLASKKANERVALSLPEGKSLSDALVEADLELKGYNIQRIAEDERNKPIYTTFAGVELDGSRIQTVHVGDSSVVIIRHGTILHATQPESYVEQLRQHGEESIRRLERLLEEQLPGSSKYKQLLTILEETRKYLPLALLPGSEYTHPRRNVVLSALGTGAQDRSLDINPEVVPVDLQVGDVVIVFSDGLRISPYEMADLCKKSEHADARHIAQVLYLMAGLRNTAPKAFKVRIDPQIEIEVPVPQHEDGTPVKHADNTTVAVLKIEQIPGEIDNYATRAIHVSTSA